MPYGRNITTTTKKYDNDEDTVSMGEAVPVVQEDNDMIDMVTKTTTDNGLSTWILLNNVASSTTTPKTTTTAATTTTKKATKKPQFQLKSTLKTTTARPENKEKPTIIRKKNTKKPTPPPTSVSTTLAIRDTKPTTKKPPTTTTTTTTLRPTVESTTFLILEPKDADFDLPQDRSPGTTKKPKRKTTASKTANKKKNQVKVAGEKKPTKANPSKEKPLSTKIYNYLAREVMPTVGVGLVGLTVAAGLATYFLGPFGGLRRSYDNAADRKDDFYYNNDDEYGGSGQSEEEVFGKVIAGMPANSPYRNSMNNMKYNAYHRNNQPMQRPSNSGIRIVQAPPQHYRVRNSGYVPGHMPTYMNTKRNDDRTQIYRYNNEPSAMSYKKHSIQEVSLTTSAPQMVPETTTQSSYFPQYSSSTSENIEIVTPSPVKEEDMDYMNEKPTNHKYPSADIPDSTNDQQMDNNVLKKRTNKYVVGTVVDTNNEDNDLMGEFPEHGPRRRRQVTGNELDAVLPDEEPEFTTIASVDGEELKSTEPSTEVPIESQDSKKGQDVTTTTTTMKPPVIAVEMETQRPNVLDLVKNLLEYKLRIGISFLQQTTQNFQRVLKQVEKSVDESKFFNRSASRTTRPPRSRPTTTRRTRTTTTTKPPTTTNE